MENAEKLVTYGTHDEDKENKNTTQYVLDTTMSKQTQITKSEIVPPTNNGGKYETSFCSHYYCLFHLNTMLSHFIKYNSGT